MGESFELELEFRVGGKRVELAILVGFFSRRGAEALKQSVEYGPYGLTHAPPRASPMRTASVYQAPAVPYHTPVRGSLSTPNCIFVAKDARYYTNRAGGPQFIAAAEEGI